MKSAHLAGLLAALALLGCESIERGRPAIGDVTDLIVVGADSLWSGVEDSVTAIVAPHVFAVHNERMFDVTAVSPVSELWTQVQQYRQILAFGSPGDSWIDDVLSAAGRTPEKLPAIVNADNVWARGQSVTAVVLPRTDPTAAFLSQVPAVALLLDDRFHRFARGRMFLSDTNTVLRDKLTAEAGFAITLPNIYDAAAPGPQLRAFHNRNKVGGDLFRSIVVSWRDGLFTEADAPRVLAWRDSIVPLVYDLEQATLTDRVEVRTLEDRAPGSIEVRALWSGTDPSFPIGGPLVDRIVVCPDQNRTYFLEAWMYGPSRRKYEYLIQFETILDSFRCGG